MSDYTWIAIVVISLVVGHWVNETAGWLTLGVSILIAMYLRRAERIREQEVRMAEAEARKRDDD